MPRSFITTIPQDLAAVGIDAGVAPLALISAAAFFACGLVAWRLIEPVYDRRARRQWASTKRQVEDLRRLTWQEFETLALAAFEKAGWQGSVVGGGGADDGVDLMLRKGSLRVVVQCKHYRARVGAPIVREAVGTAVHFRARGVYVVALGGFTKAARDWAKGKPVKLIDGVGLLHMMNR